MEQRGKEPLRSSGRQGAASPAGCHRFPSRENASCLFRRPFSSLQVFLATRTKKLYHSPCSRFKELSCCRAAGLAGQRVMPEIQWCPPKTARMAEKHQGPSLARWCLTGRTSLPAGGGEMACPGQHLLSQDHRKGRAGRKAAPCPARGDQLTGKP